MIKKILTVIPVLYCLLFSEVVFGQNNGKELSGTKPFVLGVIAEIQSAELSEKRILNIYLPEGYHRNDTTKYPVVYLLDGSADEDFIHIVGLYQFNSYPWIDRVPKSIVVGIATVDRRRDFTYPTTIVKDKIEYPTTGKSAKFISFLQNELQPFIDKNYNTNSTKTIIGQSLGGLVASEILLTKPSMFDKYIIVSPSVWWDNGSILKKFFDTSSLSFKQQLDVYIGVGKEGLTPGDIPRMMEVDANQLAEKIKLSKNNSIKVFFDYLPQENHASILHTAVYNAIRYLNPQPNRNN